MKQQAPGQSSAAAGVALNLPPGAKESDGKRWKGKIDAIRDMRPEKKLEVSLFLAFAECMGESAKRTSYNMCRSYNIDSSFCVSFRAHQ